MCRFHVMQALTHIRCLCQGDDVVQSPAPCIRVRHLTDGCLAQMAHPRQVSATVLDECLPGCRVASVSLRHVLTWCVWWCGACTVPDVVLAHNELRHNT